MSISQQLQTSTPDPTKSKKPEIRSPYFLLKTRKEKEQGF